MSNAVLAMLVTGLAMAAGVAISAASVTPPEM
jgi:hypothetical protein